MIARMDRLKTPAVARSHLKYQNRPTGGYHSVKEARRAQELKLLEKAGKIRNLQEQVPFMLIPSQREESTGRVLERPCTYVADFTYEMDLGIIFVVEDVKSPATRTKDYVIKRKLMLHVHGIRIKEV